MHTQRLFFYVYVSTLSDNMLDEAEKATLCLQACDMTVAVTKAACRIMECYILGDENPVEVRV